MQRHSIFLHNYQDDTLDEAQNNIKKQAADFFHRKKYLEGMNFLEEKAKSGCKISTNIWTYLYLIDHLSDNFKSPFSPYLINIKALTGLFLYIHHSRPNKLDSIKHFIELACANMNGKPAYHLAIYYLKQIDFENCLIYFKKSARAGYQLSATCLCESYFNENKLFRFERLKRIISEEVLSEFYDFIKRPAIEDMEYWLDYATVDIQYTGSLYLAKEYANHLTTERKQWVFKYLKSAAINAYLSYELETAQKILHDIYLLYKTGKSKLILFSDEAEKKFQFDIDCVKSIIEFSELPVDPFRNLVVYAATLINQLNEDIKNNSLKENDCILLLNQHDHQKMKC